MRVLALIGMRGCEIARAYRQEGGRARACLRACACAGACVLARVCALARTWHIYFDSGLPQIVTTIITWHIYFDLGMLASLPPRFDASPWDRTMGPHPDFEMKKEALHHAIAALEGRTLS